MAQWRKTFFSLGGPEYINDPRVDEAVALGQLLQQHQAAAGAQADRLFARQQDVAQFDERRRQFDEEQKRLASAAKMQQADNDRQFGLAQQQEQTRATEASARTALAQQGQAGDAEERLFRRAEAERSGQQFQTEQQRLRDAEIGRERESMDARYTTIDENRKAREADALKETDRYYAQRGLEVGRDQRAEKAQRGAEERQARQNDAAFARQKALLDAGEEKGAKKAEVERARVEGTAEQQRAATIAARAARFRDALETATKDGHLSDDDQAKAVHRAFTAATQPDLDPQRITREMQVLGPEGEAAASAELQKIVEEFFPKTYQAGNDQSWLGLLGLLGRSTLGGDEAFPSDVIGKLAATLAPAALENLIGGLFHQNDVGPGRFWQQRSGGLEEADRLFKRK